jgi:hypothetical protein
MFTFGLGPAARLLRAKTRADGPALPSRAIAYGAFQRVGWPRLNRGLGRNRPASAQVKAKREDLLDGIRMGGGDHLLVRES